MRALIFEGNTKERNAYRLANGVISSCEIFKNEITDINENITCDFAYPTNVDYMCLDEKTLQQYDYVFWTGCCLNAYDKSDEVLQQIEQAKIVFKSGVPYYGSCWGLQIAVMASGGMVAPCINGIEFGVAKNITLTDKGKIHPMMVDRVCNYASYCVHTAEVSILPLNASILAFNAHSKVQAIEIKHDGGIFWGVQYHPEFDSYDMEKSIQRGRETYLENGLILENETASMSLKRMMWGFEHDLVQSIRMQEIKNFINHFKK